MNNTIAQHLHRHTPLLPTCSFGHSSSFIRFLSCSFTNLSVSSSIPPQVPVSHPLTPAASRLLGMFLFSHIKSQEKKGFFSSDFTEEQQAEREDTTQASCLYLCLLGTW